MQVTTDVLIVKVWLGQPHIGSPAEHPRSGFRRLAKMHHRRRWLPCSCMCSNRMASLVSTVAYVPMLCFSPL